MRGAAVCLQYLVFPMLQPGAPPSSSAFESKFAWMFPGRPPSSLVRIQVVGGVGVSLVFAGAVKVLRESEESDAGVVSVMNLVGRTGRVGR